MRRVQVQVPASVANLGPGFDSLALAVQLYNLLTVEPIDSGLQVEIEGEGQGVLALDERNLIARAAQQLYHERGERLPALKLTCRNHIPLGAGLGSSAAAIVAGLLAADALLQRELPRSELLGLALQLEGHADNVAAALLGGLVIVGPGQDRPICHRVEPAIQEVAVVVPELDLPTRRMRAALPASVPLEDAAFNLGRTALTVEALRSGDLLLLKQAMADRLHQPYRRRHIPGYDDVVNAAHRAGAAAVALAGAGPGVIAFAAGDLHPIAEAMSAAFRGHGLQARKLVLAVDLSGAQVRLK